MAQIELDWPGEFCAFGQKTGQKPKDRACLALSCFWARRGAQVALQRSPILRTSALESSTLSSPPFAKGTFLLCRFGDISILH